MKKALKDLRQGWRIVRHWGQFALVPRHECAAVLTAAAALVVAADRYRDDDNELAAAINELSDRTELLLTSFHLTGIVDA